MYNNSHKYKRTLFLLFKLIIVYGAFYFIYQKLVDNQLLTFATLTQQFQVAFSNNIWAFIAILLCTDVNWFLEIFKWKNLVNTFQKITFFKAYEQSFGAHTASLITPNRIGEYGAKALYFKKEYHKKIVGLNFIGNMCQLTATTFFGCIGLVYVLLNFKINFPEFNTKTLLIVGIILSILLLFKKQFRFFKIEQYPLQFSQFLKSISTATYIKTLSFSFMRYLVFSHQFYFLLQLFGVKTDYFTLMSFIFCMYFFASFIPSLSIFDWVIKGSVAVWLFQFIEVNELTIITVTTFMWILNFALPAILGSVFVLNFKTTSYE
ncbi:hypothetical protein ACFQ5N_06140 [Lutibacter holmesii]|uniref:Lysylphosphatidylglycerol synthase TM region n=1 Tax=Lutibacter holmesii TaxID=1137985 RepID=A0ABW3WM58_9FLAO